MTDTYITSLSYSSYGATQKGYGSISVKADKMVIHIDLEDEDISKLKELAATIFNKHQQKAVKKVAELNVTPQLTYDEAKTISNTGDHVKYAEKMSFMSDD